LTSDGLMASVLVATARLSRRSPCSFSSPIRWRQRVSEEIVREIFYGNLTKCASSKRLTASATSVTGASAALWRPHSFLPSSRTAIINIIASMAASAAK
jgi:hypothetical protein